MWSRGADWRGKISMWSREEQTGGVELCHSRATLFILKLHQASEVDEVRSEERPWKIKFLQ